MPALAAITINDGAATPLAHTFNPSGPDKNGVNYFYDRSGGIAVGFPIVSIDLKEPKPVSAGGVSAASRVYRATVKVVYPILEVTSPTTGTGIQPAPTKSYDMMFRGEFILPERSTLQNRKDIFAFAKNILANANVTSLVQDLESIY
uniref:Coat protein n=1 Tax=Leviviridae sp. TaxID=2027243 RepID=A0A514DBA5_9VIRU|nr:MAG: hypothetical protein H2Rhizo32546e2411_000002 [Leviviridae sp.]